MEAAEVAVQLCVALGHERSVKKKLQDSCKALGIDLFQLTYEEVSFARDALAACVGPGPYVAFHAPPASTAGEATEETTGRVLPSRAARTSTGHVDSFYRLETPARVVSGPPCLRIHFFGRFELVREGEVVYLGRNARVLAILKYLLACRNGRPVSQDHLMGWLWPESDPKKARWSLNSALYALRRLLGGCLPYLPASKTVLCEGGGYRLSPRMRLSVDTDEFDYLYERGCRLEEAGRALEAVHEYEKAAELYRGDYLIEDLYEEWSMI